MQTVIYILVYAGIIQGFYMAFLLYQRKGKNAANVYLAIILSVMSLSIIHSVFVIPEIHKTIITPYRLKEPFLMLVLPFIWLYVRKLEASDFHFSAKEVLHFSPFLLFMSVNIPAFIYGSNSAWNQFLTQNSIIIDGAIWVILLIQYSFYLFRIVQITRKVRIRAQQEFSNIEQVDVSWINIFMYAFVVVFIVLAIMFAGAMHSFGAKWLNLMLSVVFSISVYILGYKGLFQKSVFSNDDATVCFNNPAHESAKQINIETKHSENLQKYMETNKPYRDPELTLTSLAKQVCMSRNQLSEVINSGLDSNFYDFVNRYRVEDVKQLMCDPKMKDYTILAIAFEAGFSSKSTFNSVFKKITGLTPSGYRNGLL